MTLHVNMFEYKGKPFADGLQAYVYAPDEEKDNGKIKNLIGNVSSRLDVRVGNNSAVAQFGNNLYCVPFNPALLPKEIPVKTKDGSFSWKIASDRKRLVPTDDSDREIIRRLVASAITKKQIQNGWFVEKYGFAYHWSFNLSKELHTEFMDVYPGFVYRPYI